MAGKDWVQLMAGLRSTLINKAAARSRQEAENFPEIVEQRRAKILAEIGAAEKLAFDPAMSDDAFWSRTCTKPFYAHRPVDRIRQHEAEMQARLGNYRDFLGTDWEPDTGRQFRAFLDEVMSERDYLEKVVKAARTLAQTKVARERTFMEWLLAGADPLSWEGRRKIYAKLASHLGYGAVTTFHLMMELGFAVVKPDQVLNRLVARMGIMTEYEVRNERTGTRRWHPVESNMTTAMARQLGQNDHFNWSLQRRMAEISKATGISMRALDIVIVKMGQVDDEANGYARTICGETPLCSLCEAKAFCDLGRTGTTKQGKRRHVPAI
ncbi:hypothetical protein [Sphingobium cloacae]|uniref:Uncharacterized protein n=1 Tax=Sphingobium cloacae TaxID=120107 RepID=A0A1E1F3J7_9SPHN|nr:hypothetical protein [Sphingobium cloacae]BAV65100.1 hypothetical protein SCLO_1020600 [Sphingobium cloacae]